MYFRLNKKVSKYAQTNKIKSNKYLLEYKLMFSIQQLIKQRKYWPSGQRYKLEYIKYIDIVQVGYIGFG